MNLAQFKKLHIPDAPGVYSFKKDGQTLYIGKATSLRERLRSYFNPDLMDTRGRRIVNMIKIADVIEFEKADSVLEAFIRETELIKKYQPITNSLSKDNKSFNYVVITDEEFPRVLVERGRNIEQNDVDYKHKYLFGPYPYGAELREALRIVRRIFPYRDTCIPASELPEGKKPKACFNRSIGLCPGVCSGEISRKEYLKIINNIRLFFSGKKGKVLANLKKQMMDHAKKQEFEDANLVKKTIYSLEHIKDISMIKREEFTPSITTHDWQGEEARRLVRIESYDIAHMSGKDMVGVMCVMTDGEFDKSQYRKFIVKDFKASNDTGALQEVLRRRLEHAEWRLPDLMVIDGGKAQLDVAAHTVNSFFKHIQNEYPERTQDIEVPQVISVVKDASHKAREILYTSDDEILINSLSNFASKEQIISLNAETHRFAITFHKKKRAESFIPGSGKKKRRG